MRVLVEGLFELGLLRGSVEGVMVAGACRPGVHPVCLEAGMVLTLDPGLYISDRLAFPEGQPAIEERWKGSGYE